MTRMIPRPWTVFASAIAVLAVGAARAADATLTVTIDDLDAAGRFPDRSAFCPPSRDTPKDVSPGVTWSEGPSGTRSYTLLMTDSDVPADLTLINKPGVLIPEEAPRIRAFHWVLADMPPSMRALPSGIESEGLIPGGKPIGPTSHGLRGANVFTSFLARQEGMSGTYGGYDGPCPPANDRRKHRYTVRVFAVDIATLGLSGAFSGEDAERAMDGHVLARGEAVGTYSLDRGR